MPAADDDELGFRDPALIAGLLPALRCYMRHYVRLEVEGLQHLTRRPALYVGNHSGGIFGPDLPCTLGVLWSELGPQAPLYAMAHDFAMRQFTPLGRQLRRFGALRAHPDNARRVLAAGGQVLVYPGGDIDAYREFRQRDRVLLGERTGFVRVAARAGVPIVPIVASGAHRSAIVLSDGAAIARQLRMKRWARLERFPIALALPWGVALGPWLPYLPLPLKVRLRILPALTVSTGDRPEAVRDVVRERMQRTLSELAGP